MKKTLILIIVVFVMIALTFGISISYVGTKVVMGESVNTKFKTGSMFVRVEDGTIENVNLVPIYDKNYKTSAYKKTFKLISGSKSLNACTSIYLNISEMSSSLKSNYFKYSLETDDKIYNGNFSRAMSGENLILANNVFIESGTTKEYTLYIWISYDDEEDQNELLGTSVSAKIGIKSYDSESSDKCIQ